MACRLFQQPPQALSINAGLIDEAWQSRPGIATQRVGPHQIDVIGYCHEVLGSKPAVDAARGVGEQQIFYSVSRQRAHRKGNSVHRMSLVIMRTAAQHHHRCTAQAADEQLPGMTADAHWRETRHLRIR